MSDGISIVIPFLNEEAGIEAFCKGLDQYADSVSFPIEAVFVDDGSTDASEKVIESYRFEHIERVKLIRFSKNFGSHAAIRAGVMSASYDICTWMAADLQDPFELINISYEKIIGKDGVDAVYIGRSSTDIPMLTKLFSRMYSHLMRRYAVQNYDSNGLQTIVFNRKIKDYLNANPESNSSIILQILNAGFKTDTVWLDFKARSAGGSKWTFSKKLKLAIDSFVAFSFVPIRMVSLVGVLFFIAGLLYGVWVIINSIINPAVPMGYSTVVCILLAGFGITNISLGIMAEYLWRTYDAARNRPLFIISSEKELK